MVFTSVPGCSNSAKYSGRCLNLFMSACLNGREASLSFLTLPSVDELLRAVEFVDVGMAFERASSVLLTP
jgi:hypothetical protein